MLGLDQISFDYIKAHYSYETWPIDFYYIHTALMKINTRAAIDILKRDVIIMIYRAVLWML